MTAAVNPEPSKGGQPMQDEVAGEFVDPSKNVLDLVKAESKYQDGMRDAETRRVNEAASAETRRVNESMSAETRRVDEIAAQRRECDAEKNELRKQIAEMLAKTTESAGKLASNQLMQAHDRISDLERFRYESSGKTSVADPALAVALADIGRGMAALKETVVTLRSTGDVSAGKTAGINWLWGFIVASGLFAISVGGFIIMLLRQTP